MNEEQVNRILEAIAPMRQDQLEDFISRAMLYERYNTELPELVRNISPRIVLFHCGICKAERPFNAEKGDTWHMPVDRRHIERSGPLSQGLSANMSGIYEFYFTCSGCHRNVFVAWIEFNYEERYIRKVGQSIAWRINLEKELEKDLGEDAELYKKALILLSQSYGIGACAYLRRIIENQINPLLQILYEMRQHEGAETSELEQIAETMRRKDFTSKVEMAAAILPDSIMIDGDNPVKLMHDRLSVNLHSLPEEEVIPIARALKTTFEYVVVELNRRKRSKQKFIEEFRALKKNT